MLSLLASKTGVMNSERSVETPTNIYSCSYKGTRPAFSPVSPSHSEEIWAWKDRNRPSLAHIDPSHEFRLSRELECSTLARWSLTTNSTLDSSPCLKVLCHDPPLYATPYTTADICTMWASSRTYSSIFVSLTFQTAHAD